MRRGCDWQEVPAEAGNVCSSFGTKGSQVQILSPRLEKAPEVVGEIQHFGGFVFPASASLAAAQQQAAAFLYETSFNGPDPVGLNESLLIAFLMSSRSRWP